MTGAVGGFSIKLYVLSFEYIITITKFDKKIGMLLDIDIEVNPIIKEWITSTYGSDTIQCHQDDFISNKLKYLLTTTPKNYKPKQVPRENKITISLINLTINKKYLGEYKYYLSESSEKIIEREFAKQFKTAFHNFVSGYIVSTSNSIGSQKEGIENFCIVYGLSLNRINYEMLKKSWDRSKEKRVLINKFSNNCISTK